ncbi:glycoside hydrolase [Rheinheimera sp. UJ51]|uniref:sialidase family protein n=1 Tax=Rheinheimera sp. UJ51 TaxID=2892446 RepID=UPI001E4F5670|nr:sialidase family protein [Rheinheimera sp. UJ51]MCC5452243.1 glycoside hydrolase [Rheinheimera sp. UJ51]
MHSRCIWQQGEHNAFTDLIAWQGALWCVFREATAHVSPDGAFRVLRSTDHGNSWQNMALVQHAAADLRDPKFSCHPDGRLMLLGAGALHDKSQGSHQSYIWYSIDGAVWSAAQAVGDINFWLWRLTWHGQQAYALAYYVGRPSLSRLYIGDSTLQFKLQEDIYQGSYANENSLLFQPDNTAYCLLRRDPEVGLLGRSTPPYRQWHWQALTARIGGPHWLQLADNRAVACVRLYDDRVRTSLCGINIQSGELTEWLTLPSGGDCSYAGMVLQDDRLLLSYYSSHESKTAIYFAAVALSELPAA